jgi:REP element-mobilizing transposase RayT
MNGQAARSTLGVLACVRYRRYIIGVSIFYDPYEEKEVYRRNLPHWLQSGRLCFVTFRLADSLPKERLDQFKAERDTWLRCNQPPYTHGQWQEYHRLFSERINAWLDQGAGSCLLAKPDNASVLAVTMAHFAGVRYRLDHWVIMPNHVHVLVMPAESFTLSGVVRGWKSFSATEINKRCGRKGAFWQSESFDHIVRSSTQLEKFRKYIIENAAAAHGLAMLSETRIDDPPSTV